MEWTTAFASDDEVLQRWICNLGSLVFMCLLSTLLVTFGSSISALELWMDSKQEEEELELEEQQQEEEKQQEEHV